jgi:hypothetical protein
MQIPLTAFSTLGDGLIMFAAWLFVGYRISQSQSTALRPVKLMRQFFFFITIFFVLMGLPHLLIYSRPDLFPIAMAWGYTVGHIFLYAAYIYLLCMTMEIIPRLTSKQNWVIWGGIVANIGITILTAVTMIGGKLPSFDHAHNVTHFNAVPAVGICIAVFSILAFVPPAVLFLINAFRSQGHRRIRSLLLGMGFLVTTIAGPLHDNAQTGQMYALADIFTVLAMITLGIGVVYRLDQSLSLSKQPAPAYN